MPLNKVIQRLVVQGRQTLPDDVRQYFGSDDDVSQRWDSAAGQYVIRDETNGIQQLTLNADNDLTDELEAGGAMELTIGNLLNFDPSRVIVDTRSNQPADPDPDTVQVVTDDQVIERYDGASWSVVGASPTAITEGGAYPVNIEDLVTATASDDQIVATNSDGTLRLTPISDQTTSLPIYGDGADGPVTHSADTTITGPTFATDFTVEAGVTVTVNGNASIFATGDVTVNGTITADGQGATGGAGGELDNSGDPGGNGFATPLQTGGAGGSGTGLAHNGGNGGDGDTSGFPSVRVASVDPTGYVVQEVRNATIPPAAAGGGGGAGGEHENAGPTEGGDGAFPGGGGGGSEGDNQTTTTAEPPGGDGGNGGGSIAVVANTISGSGTLTAAGEDGQDGTQESHSAGGGGGGGTGGVILAVSPELDLSNITTDVSGGVGGIGPVPTDNTVKAGDGADGANGTLIEINI